MRMNPSPNPKKNPNPIRTRSDEKLLSGMAEQFFLFVRVGGVFVWCLTESLFEGGPEIFSIGEAG